MANNKRTRDGEDVLSMVDVLEEDNALEAEANAVLGASDDQNCTYSLGYVDRQALYSCLTCSEPDTTPAGFCFACSLHCHDGHDLVELYTKRNFRCDCGNSKFKDFSCKLFQEKDARNDGNSYNHNFEGKYCTCGRPYPDPEDEIEDEMLQCVSCEDWFHSRHLGTLAPIEYQEMICDACMSNLDFLRWYNSIAVRCQDKSPSKKKVPDEKNTKVEKKKKDVKVSSNEKPGTSANGDASPSQNEDEKEDTTQNSCKLESLKTGNKDVDTKSSLKATFWPNNWRKLLCKCEKCKEMYKSKGVSFITNDDDTVAEYEERGRIKRENNTAYDQGMRAFGSMNRFNQVEALSGYNDLKTELHDFLKSFAGEGGKVVKKEDIERFFSGMKAKKRRRLDKGGSVQYHCK